MANRSTALNDVMIHLLASSSIININNRFLFWLLPSQPYSSIFGFECTVSYRKLRIKTRHVIRYLTLSCFKWRIWTANQEYLGIRARSYGQKKKCNKHWPDSERLVRLSLYRQMFLWHWRLKRELSGKSGKWLPALLEHFKALVGPFNGALL